MSSTRSSTSGPPLVVLVLLGALLLYFWRFGYDYGISDQDEIIPYLLHQLEPMLYQNDWFVQTQSAAFSVRDYTVALLYALSQLFPVWLAVALVYIGSWCTIAWTSYRIASAVTKMQVAGGVAVILLLVFTPRWTLGGNDFVTRMFTPSMLGWALALPAVCGTLHRRWLLSGALLGAAAWFQPLIGLLTTLALTSALLLKRPVHLRWRHFRPAFLLGGTFGLAALPTLIPLAGQQFGTPAVSLDSMPSLFFLMAEFRNPHHYLPAHFPLRSYLTFGLLAAGGTAGFIYLHRRGQLRHEDFLIRLLTSIGLLVLIGFIGTSVVPVLFLTKLQLFKLTVLAKLVFIIGAAGGFVHLSKRLWHRLPLHQSARWGILGVLLVSWLGTVYGIHANQAISNRLMRPWAHNQTPLGQVEQWVRVHTPRDAVFAVPPSISSFRSNARRAQVVSFKAFPFRDVKIGQWWQRLVTLAPLNDRAVGGAAALSHLDAAYHQHDGAAWRRIAKEYDITFILVDRRQQHSSLPFPIEISRHHWTLYRVSGQ